MAELATYRRKRDFSKTREPPPHESRRKDRFFVVQKHAASRLHYDFRLAIDGVLVSWAVTKGPSLDPADKRLAVRTEDHPIDYGAFEGTIPAGEYGGGTVMLWDRGAFEAEGDPVAGLRQGKLKVTLHGDRLKGGFALVRMRPRDGEKRENWLLIKERDEEVAKDRDILAEDRSVATGRSMEQIAGEASPKRARQKPRTAARKGPSREKTVVEIAGIRLSNPDRVLFPSMGVTKQALAEYFEAVSEAMLPHLRGRPVSLVRCPEGSAKECFFQKHAGAGLAEAIGRVPIAEKKGGTKEYLLVESRAALVACAQIGALELHLWGSRRDRIERPDRLVFDLDPGEGVDFAEVKRAAVDLAALLREGGLESAPLLTGGKGLHLVISLERRDGWATVSGFAKAFAAKLEELDAKRFVATMSKAKRGGRIFVDHFRNQRGATAIAPFSPRAREGAPVAVPVSWSELDGIARPNLFSLSDVLGDLKERTRAWRDLPGRQRLTRKGADRLGISLDEA